MVNPLTTMVLQKGVSNVDVSKLTPGLKKSIFEEAGETLLNRGDHDQAALAFSIAQSPKLKENAEFYAKAKNYRLAAYYAQYIEDPDLAEQIAAKVLEINEPKLARAIYEKMGNTQMVTFIDSNF